ncbi:hypothetical protein AVL61_04965 [Kocuria rosea subsp. polaris]|uniref:Uncharacterized protein n=1 Tax=Kocuria rosea subsp. polaris TaxID=136273 RepID=A0A0W8I7U8_KOCRO|nr:hypothetical protein [Kocuria polaris]KUG55486.1 hypothetical protein AVL61_04965 [Kocuria polaris]
MAETSTGQQVTSKEKFRFTGWKLSVIAALIIIAGIVLVERIWEAASRMGLLSAEASGDDFSRAQTNLLLVALLLVGTSLLVAGTVLLFAETKRVKTTTATAPAAPTDNINSTGVVSAGAAAVKLGSMIAEGMSSLKGGSVTIFGGVALFIVAAWIATAGMPDGADEATQDDAPAASAELR